MADYEGEPERAWDEYQWERFLQQQEGKAEKYMQLLEEYLDDPQRDEIIAREMGWTQLLDARDWSAELDALPDGAAIEEDDPDIDEASRAAESFEGHDDAYVLEHHDSRLVEFAFGGLWETSWGNCSRVDRATGVPCR